ncbi:Fe-S cluster assembly protein SufD [Brytella acorum]|uniref:Fe-S cluster assembly protein SufD n=1 Tax=Brytella acorum TaxID=2959299 RepID=A0AA35UEK5_9PROT|nr:Fe-S cluster assembly protein SufD [Brytella acorum]MDF3624528.1 Fe-S cluster assembly protein SufD [Brytella acorum]CAI9119623.1 Fe-S cluster assembly protein SufD [Brytella acorum]
MSSGAIAKKTETRALQSFLKRAGKSAALPVLKSEGLPHRGIEAWHYTSLRVLEDLDFAEATPLGEVDAQELLRNLVPDLTDGPRVVFVNGFFMPSLSSLPAGVTVVEREAVSAETHPLTVLNAALGRGGVRFHVPEGVDAGNLAIVSLSSAEHPISTHLRHEIALAPGARLTLLEIHAGQGTYLSNPVLRFDVSKAASVRHVKLQADSDTSFHLAFVEGNVAEEGTYDSFTLTLGGRLARHEVRCAMRGLHGNVHVNAAQILDGERHADLTSRITHAAPHCNSRQTVKNVITDAAHAVFQGKIEVERIAQKTDGYQMNQALLLSDRAQIDSKPELEIYADDVKCSHGATIGALDDEQLFYLRSRGIPEIEAKAILVRAFLGDALDLIVDEGLRSWLDARVDAWWAKQVN